ncbi:hypothetical protein RHP75_08540 [Pseudomonas sp. SG20056]|uniref:hypothetical protein n=1 Tax=Pseudomonas sp. SG20056 TaxID=3074146 RepID=UPI00287F8596|nr:hypothetical protein [Pseudomonas sp. SG20056]WNF48445.1 hypothetical protein RHP75_08540 [Pseudomonas sp. SG20056]
MNILWDWTPNKSLGPVKIGSSIDAYILSLGFIYDEDSDPADGWVSYIDKAGDVYIDVSDGLVVSITSYGEFYYKSLNLIGATILELGALVGRVADEVGSAVEFDDGDIKNSYDYFDLGLQVWASQGVITSATCLSYDS